MKKKYWIFFNFSNEQAQAEMECSDKLHLLSYQTTEESEPKVVGQTITLGGKGYAIVEREEN